MSEASLCRAYRTGEIVLSKDYPDICPIFPLADALTHSCIPMTVGGKVLGVVQFLFPFVTNEERERKLQDNLIIARRYLRELLPVLQAKRLAASLHRMSIQDPLTGLYNRRFLESSITHIVDGVKRRGSTLGILMCDLDYFKKVNDELGHEAGDAILKSLAEIFTQVVRSSDYVIRYGGEEFLILLLDCQQGAAVEIAEKLRRQVENFTFLAGSRSVKKTISIGVSELPHDSEAFWEAVKYADVALYQAKENGRNQVCRFTPEMWSDEEY